MTINAMTVPRLTKEIRSSLRRGARAPQLLRYSRPLVEMLYPDADEPIYDRAIHAEDAITDAVAAMDTTPGTAVGILLCLRPGTAGTTLEARREHAAGLYKVTAKTFRGARYEGEIILDLSMTLYRRAIT